MKKLPYVLLYLMVIAAFCGCSRTRVDLNADVTLTFIYGELEIRTVLPDNEAAKVIHILDRNDLAPVSFGTPSCGFSENVSLKVGDQLFAIACDTCELILDVDAQRYFDVTQEEMGYIHSLFEKYGGYFPCI